MKKTATIQDIAYFNWAAARIPGEFDPNETRWMAQLDDGDIVAVVMYTSFSRFDCCMHLATARKDWANKEFLHKAFAYPFIDMALERVTFATDSSNEAAIRLHKKLGAKYEGTLRRFHGFRDMVIHGMLKDECKFLEEKKWVDC